MPIRIGVFAPYGAQTLDAACVDILGSMSKEYLSLILELPSYIAADLAPSTTFSYINSPSQGDKIELTSGIVMNATHNYEDEDVAPGKLDIVIIPGPDPNTVLEEPALNWLRKQFATPGVDILSICTGIFLVGASGIGNNKTVSGPRGLQKQLSEKFPKMKLAGEKYRWVRDGNLWSSGGVTNGNDLMAAYARETTKYWPGPVCEIGLKLTDTGDRAQVYGQGQSAFMLSTGWQVIRGWFTSLWRGKNEKLA